MQPTKEMKERTRADLMTKPALVHSGTDPTVFHTKRNGQRHQEQVHTETDPVCTRINQPSSLMPRSMPLDLTG